jgi:hypothetical protein
MVEEREVEELVGEYLSRCGLVATRDCFRKEKHATGGDWKRSRGAIDRALSAFDGGDHSELFSIWHEVLPSEVRRNRDAQRLEFVINVHMALIPFSMDSLIKCKSVEQASKACARSMAVFKRYLDTRGQRMSKESDFVPYFALPYVPDPSDHPSYAPMFEKSWQGDLRGELEGMLREFLPEDSPPLLVRALVRSKGNMAEALALSKELLAVATRCVQFGNSEDEALLSAARMRLQRLLGEKSEPLRDEGGAADMIEVPGLSEKHLVPADYGGGRQALHQKPTAPLMPRKGSIRRSVSRTILPPINYAAVRGELSRLMALVTAPPNSGREDPPPNIPPAISCALLLQALRWRFASATPGKDRRGVLYYYIRHDFLGIQAPTSESGESLLHALLDARRGDGLVDQHCELIIEYTARLLNAIATMSRARTYLLGGGDAVPIVEMMVRAMKREKGDTSIRKNLLGGLQKVSLRQAAQAVMIGCGAVSYFAEVLSEHVSETCTMSAYSLEYLTALLMNLSLRPSGRDEIEKSASRLLPPLMGLLECPSPMVHEFVNSTIYSALQRASIREQATALGMQETINALLQDPDGTDPTMRRQLTFVLERLKHGAQEQPGEEGGEQDQDLEVQESEEDGVSPDEMPESEVLMRYANSQPSGERLLAATFALSSAGAHLLLQEEQADIAAKDGSSELEVSPNLTVLPSILSVGSDAESDHPLERSFAELTEEEIKALDETREAFRKKERLIRTPQGSMHGAGTFSSHYFDAGG